ncbi:glycosyltransferase family 4 protein [Halomonas organivorans]
MKFLFFNHSEVFGGQERYLSNITLELSRRGYCSGVISESPGLGFLVSPEEVDKNQVDFVVLNGNAALYKLRNWLGGTCCVIYVQHSNIRDKQASFVRSIIRKILFRFLLLFVDGVVRVCDCSLPDIYAPKKIKTIYNGVNLPRRKVECNERFTVVVVGSVNSNKNQIQAIDVLRYVSGVCLVVVGSGLLEAALKEYAEQRGVSDRITWTGHVDNPEDYISQAHALLMLSKYEAFPYAVLEAMSLGRPVISYPVGGVPEILEDDVNGVLLPDRDFDKLCQAVVRLRDCREDVERLGAAARKTIEERFTVEHMTDQFLEFVEEIARRKGRIT